MLVNQKVAAGSILVLTDTSFDDRCVAQCRKAPPDKLPNFFGGALRNNPRLRVWIDALAMCVQSDLQSPVLDVGHAVAEFLLEQECRECGGRKARVSGRDAEKEDFLAAGKNASGQNVREHFSEPGPAGKHKATSRKLLSVERGN